MALKTSSWWLVLDPVKMRVQVVPSESCDSKLCMKTLSLKDMGKFGREITGSKYQVLPGYIMKCHVNYCHRWLNGSCFRHPLVFVKEHLPSSPSYDALSTVPSFMEVRPSSIPEAGVGVFTRMKLPAGVAFGPYAGHLMNSTTAKLLDYAWQSFLVDWSVIWVDAKMEKGSNWMRYVNCPRFEEEQNMVSLFFHGNTYYYTYKPVEANTELMVWYGDQYAAELGIKCEYPPGCEGRNMAPPKDYKKEDEIFL